MCMLMLICPLWPGILEEGGFTNCCRDRMQWAEPNTGGLLSCGQSALVGLSLFPSLSLCFSMWGNSITLGKTKIRNGGWNEKRKKGWEESPFPGPPQPDREIVSGENSDRSLQSFLLRSQSTARWWASLTYDGCYAITLPSLFFFRCVNVWWK